MSDVKVTTLANGLRVAVDAMPEVESASLGIWVGLRHAPRERRAERHGAHARAHGVQGHPDALGPRHRRGDRECRRQPQRLYRPRDHGLPRLGAEGGRGARRRDGGRHPAQFGVRSRRAAARARRHPAGDRPGARHARRPDLRPVPGDRAARPAARPAGAGHGRLRSRRSAATICSPILARHYTASNMVLSAAGRVEHDQIVDLAEKHFGSVPRTPANAEAPVPLRLCRRRRPRGARARAGAPGAGLRGHRLSRSRLFRARRLLDAVRRRHVLAPVPAHPRGARPGLRHPLLQRRLCRRRPVRHLCRHRRGRSGRAGARPSARSSSSVADTLSEAGAGARPQPDQGRHADGARIERRALRAGGAPSA